jgi:hypothetical protein
MGHDLLKNHNHYKTIILKSQIKLITLHFINTETTNHNFPFLNEDAIFTMVHPLSMDLFFVVGIKFKSFNP